MIFKECEDEDGYEGGRLCSRNFKTDEEFQRSMMEFVMERFEASIFPKRYDENACRTKLITLNSK